MYAILLFQKQLQKNLCGCYIRCIELIYRLHDNLPGWLLTGPKSFMNWRYKTGRSGNQVRREAVRITGHQVPRYVGLGACTVLQQSWAGKQCMEKFILSISNHRLSRLSGVWFQEKSLLHCISSLTGRERISMRNSWRSREEMKRGNFFTELSCIKAS